ncbi:MULTISPECIES: aspartate aminotransferase family protein [Hyphomicrobiales]|uniref:aspartate aminotransferase family protein n=1 Tax=Hyphomicrobiales TaxID=356 RepID=UPI001C0C7982|nr:aspartate aminotransferase family protein [Rhizobium sp. X9]MCH4541898.1 aspartate aminotransferase family protein [Ochrobactrum sp. A-1]
MSVNLRNERSTELFDRAKLVVPGGVNTARRKINPPLAISHAKGSRMWDLDGNEFIDYHAAYGAVFLGHSDERIVEAVTKEAGRRVLTGVGITETEAELAERIVRSIPSAEQVLLCNTGSEATFYALRLARAITGKQKILKFQGCYHGYHDAVAMNNQSSKDALGHKDVHSAGLNPGVVENTVIARYNDLEDVKRVFAENAGEIAGIIIEPIAHSSPAIVPVPGFLEGLRSICDAENALLIFDEIVTGFRHHIGGYQAIVGVLPDITTVGKALGNGFPVAAVCGKEEHMRKFNTHADGIAMFAGTYNGNGVASAAGLAVLKILEDTNLYAHVFSMGNMMRDGLSEIVKRNGINCVVSGFGGVYALSFMQGPLNSYDDVVRNDGIQQVRYRQQLINRGVFEMPERGGRNHISIAHSESDIAKTLEIAEAALLASR